jgi:hypothetical protein
MVGWLAVVDLGADQILLKHILGAADGMLDGEPQEASKPVGLCENGTLQKPIQFFPDRLFRKHNIVCFVHSFRLQAPPIQS